MVPSHEEEEEAIVGRNNTTNGANNKDFLCFVENANHNTFYTNKNMIAQRAPAPAPVSLLLYSNLSPSPASPSPYPSLLRHRPITPSPRLILFHKHRSNPKTQRATINQSVTAEEEEEEEEEEAGVRGGYVEGEGEDFSFAAAETTLRIERNGKNSRRISVTIPVSAPLDTLWRALTDYERLSEFIPGLSVCEVQERWHDGARLYQIGEQNLAFGLKFKAKGVIIVTEKQLEAIPCGIRRSIEFEMVEGDFKIFKGAWQMEEVTSTTDNDITKTLLTYVVDVQPKAWLPVRLVEGRLSYEIQNNLVCVRNEAQRLEWTSSPSGCDPTCHE